MSQVASTGPTYQIKPVNAVSLDRRQGLAHVKFGVKNEAVPKVDGAVRCADTLDVTQRRDA